MSETKTITVNHNDIVRVKLDPSGVEAYRKYYKGADPRTGADGWTEFPLWELVWILAPLWEHTAPFQGGNIKIELDQLATDPQPARTLGRGPRNIKVDLDRIAPGQLRGEHS